MSTRFLLVVLLAGLCGLWLLSMRQQRIVLIHDMSVLHSQLTADRAKLWQARADVAGMTAPSVIDAATGPEWVSAMHQEGKGHHDEP
ncbi:MAG: hypothetical protein P8I91_06215 [Phycisphaerales bacterium]|jgi:hypothetical protein|nr:hypothetical protein [Phycisphaerales bacterium]